MQFERDDEKEIAQKVESLVRQYELPGLAPKPNIQPHIQEAIQKVPSLSVMHTDKRHDKRDILCSLAFTDVALSISCGHIRPGCRSYSCI